MSEYLKVRVQFIAQGTSLNRWCEANGVKRQNARKALTGEWAGPKGQAMRQRLLHAAGLRRHD